MANLILVTPTNPGIAEWSDGNALFGYPFPWYGSGTDGPLVIADTFYVSAYYTQNTTFTMSNSMFIGLCSTPEQSYVEIMATQSITITGSGIFSQGNSGEGGVFGGGGGNGGPGASPGTDGKIGTTGAGAGQGFSTVINMTNRLSLGARALGGSGGATGANGGGDGGQADVYACAYFPPFRALFIGGTAPRWAISAGGFGGGAGAGDGANLGGNGGGGGGGGGAIVLRAPTISITDNSGLLVQGAPGGDGQNGTAGNAGGGGGGAGGNGGVIIFVTESLTVGDTEFVINGGDGGVGGGGSGTGGAGGAGSEGVSGEAWWYRPSTNTWTQVA